MNVGVLSGIRRNLYVRNNNIVKTENTKEEFQNKVMKCVAAGNREVMLSADAIISYGSPRTGETVNIYRADDYAKDHPVYVIKGLDADGSEFKQEIDAGKIDPHTCSFNEMMVLNAETGHTSPGDYLHAVATRDKSGTGSYFEMADYISYAKEVMSDMKSIGNWKTYLSYDKWIKDILHFCKR